MSEPYIGEIRIFGFNFAPRGWAFCDGQTIPISQNTALFSILGTVYGGNGTTTFQLPNLQDRAPMHWRDGPGLTPRTLGEVLGSPTVTLTNDQIPSHSHALFGAVVSPANAAQQVSAPTNQAYVSISNPGQAYATTNSPPVAFAPQAIGNTGGNQPHENLQPILALNFCIALEGIFPSRN